MIRSIGVFVALSSLTPSGLAAETQPAPLRATVRLYDYAKPGTAILERARAETERLLAAAGVELEWKACPLTVADLAHNPSCNAPLGAADLVIRLLSPEMRTAVSSRTETFGFALVNGRETPQVASVRYGAVEAMAWAEDSSYGTLQRMMPQTRFLGLLLGHVLAHEIGHLLLASNEHAADGLMQAHWRAAAIRDAATRRLAFGRREREKIRKAVQRRTGRRN